MTYPECWVLTDGRKGMENQAVGLAEAVGLKFTIKRLAPRAPWKWLPPSIFGRPWPWPMWALGTESDQLVPPWPHLLIACGRQTIAYSIAIRRLSKGQTFTVQTQDPRINAKYFDLIVPPRHDHLTGQNIFPITGSPNRVTDDRLAEARDEFASLFSSKHEPRIAVLIGGASKHYRLTPEKIADLSAQLRKLADDGPSLMITTSRRTGAENVKRLRDALEDTSAYIWNGQGPNPYFAILAYADHILVTSDSTNMVTEAASTGKPVHIINLEGGSDKFERFHQEMQSLGITRDFAGALPTWPYEPLRETQRVAQHIRQEFDLDP